MSAFIVSFNLFGEFDHFEDLDAAEEKERRECQKKEMRHKEVTPEELISLEDDKDEINTRKTTRWAVKTLRDFLAQKNMDTDFESYTDSTLNDTLRLFYASVQSTKEGGKYSLASLRCLRAGINRHLKDVDIISDAAFKSSNVVFKAILKRCRKSGEDASFHHPRISQLELDRIRRSPVLSPDTPLGLLRKVWFDIQLWLPRRSKEGNRELTMTSFIIQKDEHGVEYVSHADCKDPSELNKQNPKGFMFARPGDPLCSVKSFKKYVSKCPQDAKYFYLHPKRPVALESDVWYSKDPLGINYLGDMLKNITREVGLSRIYTNLSLRSTAMALHADAGPEAGLHCESSPQEAPSIQERREWSNILLSRNVSSSSVVPVAAPLSVSAAAPAQTSTTTTMVPQASILQLITSNANAVSTLPSGITTQSQPGTLVLKTTPGSGMVAAGQPLVIQLPLSVNGQTGTLVNFPVSTLSPATSLNKSKTTPSTTTFILKPSPATNAASATTTTVAALPAIQASSGQVTPTQISLARAVYQGGAGRITTPSAGVSVTTVRAPAQSVSVAGAMSSTTSPATSGPAATGSTAPGPPQGTSLTSKTDNQSSGASSSKPAAAAARPKGSVIDLTEDDDDVQVTGVKNAPVTASPSGPRSNLSISTPTSAGARSSPKNNQNVSNNPQITVHHRPPQDISQKSRNVSASTLTRTTSTSLPLLPPAPVPLRLPPEAEQTSPPQQLQLKLVPGQTGIVLSWSVTETDRSCAAVDSYHLYAFHQDNASGTGAQQNWKKIGEVNALPLPMACTLTQFQSGSTYYFAVRAKDIYGRFGSFCEPQCTNVISASSS